ncbi:hypothetical protein SGFS_024930 [Streptomyces graminofaciens]|uniref:Uncharacterized protein n=1 Tax=Streptomyces graminofaciens TaxID=68212 RepID=A0ABM7F5M1_9ACTN|nr:hypothetical protein SGFS_024930 [Streptomyces graminofaciens]
MRGERVRAARFLCSVANGCALRQEAWDVMSGGSAWTGAAVAAVTDLARFVERPESLR